MYGLATLIVASIILLHNVLWLHDDGGTGRVHLCHIVMIVAGRRHRAPLSWLHAAVTVIRYVLWLHVAVTMHHYDDVA